MLVPRFVVSVPAVTATVTIKVNEVEFTFVTVQIPFNLVCCVPVAPATVIDCPVAATTAPAWLHVTVVVPLPTKFVGVIP